MRVERQSTVLEVFHDVARKQGENSDLVLQEPRRASVLSDPGTNSGSKMESQVTTLLTLYHVFQLPGRGKDEIKKRSRFSR